MQSLQHPGICRLFDTYEDDHNVYLILEYIDGHELFDEIVAPQRMTESRAARIMQQLLEVLQHCHSPEHNIVHRDVKPENLMVRNPLVRMGTSDVQPEVKLIDFGLAVHIGQKRNGVAGTRPYLAPEAYATTGVYDPALDVWSAGVVLHALLAGELPPAAVRMGAAPLDVESAYWAKHGVSEAARDLLACLLCAEPGKRLTAAQAAKHPWVSRADTETTGLSLPQLLPTVSSLEQAEASAAAFGKMLGVQRLQDLRRDFVASLSLENEGCVPKGEAKRWAATVLSADDGTLSFVGEVLDLLDVNGSNFIACADWLEWLASALQAAGSGSSPAAAAFTDGRCGTEETTGTEDSTRASTLSDVDVDSGAETDREALG